MEKLKGKTLLRKIVAAFIMALKRNGADDY